MSTGDEDIFKTILDGVYVLIVDDSAENRDAVEHFLVFHGAEVTQANSAAEAGHAVETNRPDVIVADDGVAVVMQVRLREPKDGHPIPVIALIALGSDEDNEALTKAGCHAVLCKPFDPEQLITIVAASIGRC